MNYISTMFGEPNFWREGFNPFSQVNELHPFCLQTILNACTMSFNPFSQVNELHMN